MTINSDKIDIDILKEIVYIWDKENYAKSDKINISDVQVWGVARDMIRVVYWVVAGELRTFDISCSDYIKYVRDKKLEEIGI